MHDVAVVLARGARNTGILLAAALTAWVTMVLALLLADIGFVVTGQGGGSIAIVAFFTLPFWLLGLPTVGGVVWALADHLEMKGLKTAMVIGAVVAGFCSMAVLVSLAPSMDAGVILSQALAGLSAAAGGAVAGRVIWKLAYQRTPRA